MKTELFNQIVEKQCEEIKKVLMKKAQEYASDEDRLYNFKAAARVNNTTPLLALWGMATKHLVCVQDLISGKLEIKPETVNEKVGDLINYLILAKALMVEEYQDPFQPTADVFVEGIDGYTVKLLPCANARLLMRKGDKVERVEYYGENSGGELEKDVDYSVKNNEIRLLFTPAKESSIRVFLDKNRKGNSNV
jgi:hypothetical protein